MGNNHKYGTTKKACHNRTKVLKRQPCKQINKKKEKKRQTTLGCKYQHA
jgi:hypothetical protein